MFRDGHADGCGHGLLRGLARTAWSGPCSAAMTTPGAPLDSSDIDSGWDDLEPSNELETAPSMAPPSMVPAKMARPNAAPPNTAPVRPSAQAQFPAPTMSSPERAKRVTKSRDERDAKAARKAAKQAARRAERRASGAQNQKRPIARTSSAPTPSRDTAAQPVAKRRGAAEQSAAASHTPAVFTLRRTLMVAAVIVCLLVIGGLAWFLGWRNGGTMSLQ
jgi:hypothetical protein